MLRKLLTSFGLLGVLRVTSGLSSVGPPWSHAGSWIESSRYRFLSPGSQVYLIDGLAGERIRSEHMTELDRALSSTMAVLQKVQPTDLDAPTPCASWDVRALVNHFVDTARWWAGVVSGTGEHTDADYTAGDFVAAYEESARMAAAAFEADGVLGRMIRLPFGEFPGAAVRSMAALDQFAHGWDLARAIGYQGEMDPELATELLAAARLAITDSFRGPDGQAPFGPVRPAPAEAGPADQLAAYLGRSV
jgi:uncharacterized protein (TIGR03086 family)